VVEIALRGGIVAVGPAAREIVAAHEIGQLPRRHIARFRCGLAGMADLTHRGALPRRGQQRCHHHPTMTNAGGALRDGHWARLGAGFASVSSGSRGAATVAASATTGTTVLTGGRYRARWRGSRRAGPSADVQAGNGGNEGPGVLGPVVTADRAVSVTTRRRPPCTDRRQRRTRRVRSAWRLGTRTGRLRVKSAEPSNRHRVPDSSRS
jgi:hypothetical protein